MPFDHEREWFERRIQEQDQWEIYERLFLHTVPSVKETDWQVCATIEKVGRRLEDLVLSYPEDECSR